MKKLKRIMIVLIFSSILFLICKNSSYAVEVKANYKEKVIKTNLEESEKIISNINELGIVKNAVVYSKPSSVYEFFDENDRYNLVYATEKNVYWSKFDVDMNLYDTISTPVIYDKSNVSEQLKKLTYTTGAYIYYKENLYVIYARAIEDVNDYALALVKYNKDFEEIAREEVKAKDIVSNPNDLDSAMKLPFYGSNCSVAINKNTLLVFLGKGRIDGNEDSSTLFFNIDTMTWIEDATKYGIIHSLGQRVIATSDGNFLLAETGDTAESRGLNITQIDKSGFAETKIMFHYGEGINTDFGHNSTYHALGNIIEVSDGYIYIGGAEPNLHKNYGNVMNESWNIFVQKYERTNFDNKTSEELQMLEASLRQTTGEPPIQEEKGKLFLKGNETDYGVKWLIDLQGQSSVVHIRAVKLEDNQVAIIWQEAQIEPHNDSGYIYDERTLSAYYMVIDKDTNIITPKTEIPYAGTLSVEENYVYNAGKVYWATTSEKDNTLKIHILNIENQFTHSFNDVKPKEWYSEAIQYVYKNDIMKGYDEQTFVPNDTVTRGSMITILYRLENEASTQNDKEYDNKAIYWAAKNGIISGTYDMDTIITREDFAVIFCNYAKYKGIDTTKARRIDDFVDCWDTSYYAYSSMRWAVTAGLISGNQERKLLPKQNTTRAELACAIKNYCERVKNK